MTCSFIESLQNGAYTEKGEITIDASAWYFNVTNWKSSGEYMRQVEHVREVVAPWQLLAIIASVAACFIMCI